MNIYEETLALQSKNSQVASCKTYYSWLYSLMCFRMNLEGKYLEVGAGAGISRYFLPNFNILRTDILPWDKGEVLGGIDAQDLPYTDGEFAGVLGMDMIHHVSNPAKLLEEVIRVTKKSGDIVFVEPYVSIFSYPVYRFFHPERVTIPIGFDRNMSWVSESASDGDQGVAQRLFCTKSGRKFIQDFYGTSIILEVDYLSPFAFYLTGGLNKPFKISSRIVNLFMKIDSVLPRAFRKFTAARMIIRIRLAI